MADGGGKADSGNKAEPQKREKVAQLVYTADARWVIDRHALGNEQDTRSPRNIKAGKGLYVGEKLYLDSGVAEIKFFNGAEVVLEGPAEFEVQGKKQCRLEFGKLVAIASEKRSKGFIVDTPAARVEDLGTEFGVAVDASGLHRVEVLDGKVEVLRFADDAVVTLTAGEAVRIAQNDPNMVVSKLADLRGHFVRGILVKRFHGRTRLELQDAVSVSLHGTESDPKTAVAQVTFDGATQYLIRERRENLASRAEQQGSLKRRARLFMKFDVSRLTGKVDYASLQMKVAARLPNAAESVINVARVTSAWDTRSGSNFPLFKQPLDDVVPTRIDDDARKGTAVTVDLTNLVQQWIDGTHPNHGLVIYFDKREFIGQSYAAGMTDTAPRLSVTLADMETRTTSQQSNALIETTELTDKHRME